MAAQTNIEWTDHTFNPWIGCSKVHAGCANCYAERDFDHRRHRAKWGPNGTRSLTSTENWRQPLKWNRLGAAAGEQPMTHVCRQCGTRYYCEVGSSAACDWKCEVVPYRPRVFCASLADVFEDWQGPIVDQLGEPLSRDPNRPGVLLRLGPIGRSLLTMDDLRRDLFAMIDQTQALTWQLLTKRPENIRRMWTLPHNGVDPGSPEYLHRRNVHLLTSVSDDATAAKQVPELLACRYLAPVLGLSCEPLLGPLNIAKWLPYAGHPDKYNPLTHCAFGVDWVIVGCESAAGKQPGRPMKLEWAESIVDQCRAASVPCFVKQLEINGRVESDPRLFPKSLQVREFPREQADVA